MLRMLKLLDIMPIGEADLSRYKIHFAIGIDDSREPLYELSQNTFKKWQEHQNKRNFERDYIFSLVYYGPDEWVFGGVYKALGATWVKGRGGGDRDHYEYKTELMDWHKELIRRLVIHYEKRFRASYVYLEKNYDKLVVSEILKKPYSMDPFPGFENVKIDFSTLKAIIKEEEPSWKSALSSVYGIYLITDKINGMLYVGSAYGGEAFWNRWADYAANGHGGNKKLKAKLKENGFKYAHNFQFSILEVRSKKSILASDTEIIARENFYKEILKSREFGYNKN